MSGLFAIYRKELADHFGSWRFMILYVVICLAGAAAVYGAGQAIRNAMTGATAPSFAFLLLFTVQPDFLPLPFYEFIAFLGPLVGLGLTFDAINGERNRGTMSHLLAQPIYRDAVINGKFLAALTTVAVMLASLVLVVCGLGIRLLGVVPTPEEALRLLAFLIVCILYVGFWMALSTLFSLLLRQTATSALAGIASWIFFTFFVSFIVGAITSGWSLANVTDINQAVDMVGSQQMLSRISPNTLFAEATIGLLRPDMRTLNPLLGQLNSMMSSTVPNPLPVGESLMMVWPQVVGLLALTAICFAIAYTKFMTEEIRAL